MTTNDFLLKLKELLIKGGFFVTEIETTHGNFDNLGNLITAGIPTITTNLCEMGIHGNDIYFVFIIDSNTYNKKLFGSIKIFNNIKIYGFKNFRTTLYPVSDFLYRNFEKEIKKEKYFQIQFDYDSNVTTPGQLYKKYNDINDIFIKNKTKVINQMYKII